MCNDIRMQIVNNNLYMYSIFKLFNKKTNSYNDNKKYI